VRPERVEAGAVEIRPDLGGGRLATKLVHVLRRLEELEAIDVNRSQVLEHLREAARKRHQRAEIGWILRIVRAAQVAHRRRQAESVAGGDAEPRGRIPHREVLDAEPVRWNGRVAAFADAGKRASDSAEVGRCRNACGSAKKLPPSETSTHCCSPNRVGALLST
jgi:hypothetical protein